MPLSASNWTVESVVEFAFLHSASVVSSHQQM